PRLRDPFVDHALVGERLAVDDAAEHPPTHQLERTFGHANEPHAMVDPTRTQARLRDREALAGPGDDVRGRHPDVGAHDLGVSAVWSVVVPEDRHASAHVDTGGVTRHQDLALLAMPFGGWVGLTHHDENLAPLVHCAGRPPLAAIDDVLITVALDACLDVVGVRRRDVRFGHAERRPDLA